jgi:hypothetical protein
MSPFSPYLEAFLAVTGSMILLAMAANKSPVPLPPGPRRLPLLGNLLNMPSSQEWLTFAQWGKKYGPFLSP